MLTVVAMAVFFSPTFVFTAFSLRLPIECIDDRGGETLEMSIAVLWVVFDGQWAVTMLPLCARVCRENKREQQTKRNRTRNALRKLKRNSSVSSCAACVAINHRMNEWATVCTVYTHRIADSIHFHLWFVVVAVVVEHTDCTSHIHIDYTQ